MAAMWGLAALGDDSSLRVVSGRAESAETQGERSVARAAALVLREDEGAIVEGLRRHQHEDVPALAVAARMLGTEASIAALRAAAADSPDDECRSACRAELEMLGDGS